MPFPTFQRQYHEPHQRATPPPVIADLLEVSQPPVHPLDRIVRPLPLAHRAVQVRHALLELLPREHLQCLRQVFVRTERLLLEQGRTTARA